MRAGGQWCACSLVQWLVNPAHGAILEAGCHLHGQWLPAAQLSVGSRSRGAGAWGSVVYMRQLHLKGTMAEGCRLLNGH